MEDAVIANIINLERHSCLVTSQCGLIAILDCTGVIVLSFSSLHQQTHKNSVRICFNDTYPMCSNAVVCFSREGRYLGVTDNQERIVVVYSTATGNEFRRFELSQDFPRTRLCSILLFDHEDNCSDNGDNWIVAGNDRLTVIVRGQISPPVAVTSIILQSF